MMYMGMNVCLHVKTPHLSLPSPVQALDCLRFLSLSIYPPS